MNNHYHHLAFGPAALERQRERGSYNAYGAQTERPDDGPMELDQREKQLIASRDEFQIATVTESGWPYMQYRSGPKGFLHVLDDGRLGFADFRGNNQYVTTANIDADGRVALFIVDYPTKQRLKLYGRAEVIDGADDPELLDRLQRIGDTRIAAVCERSVVFDVEAFDWNCTRSIIPRYDREYLKDLSAVYQRKAEESEAALKKRIAALEAEVERLKSGE